MMSSDRPDTRTRILNTAWKLLESGDSPAVRMGDIAKGAGISRQALYLHFPNRAELLVAVTRHIDQVRDVDARLAPSRAAKGGAVRLTAFVEAWCGYIPEIHGVARALLAMAPSDAEARDAWADRMRALREGCAAAVAALARDGALRPDLPQDEATDLLWAMLSVRNWEALVVECGWPQERYLAAIQRMARHGLMQAPG